MERVIQFTRDSHGDMDVMKAWTSSKEDVDTLCIKYTRRSTHRRAKIQKSNLQPLPHKIFFPLHTTSLHYIYLKQNRSVTIALDSLSLFTDNLF